ncbi:BofC C-terminal domain-containing protein [Defluviitalea phaphyphila]|uniref:BofC C-terminal domain-containing protein n=1 Tax=Defluviitalea phaphyphila TaxID=1473580 RepID=UPI000730E21B|nr:BofC C-terminal domain-containing protein [Defluviitalea phaphyphila]
MFIKKKIWLLSSAIFIISFLGVYSFYMYLISPKSFKEPNSNKSVEDYINKRDSNISEVEIDIQKIAEKTPVSKTEVPKITESTDMIYQYYYEDNGKVVEERIKPPYFLIDLTREELEKKYSDWQITSFSNKEVVMKKNIPATAINHYMLGTYNGYLAIFYYNHSKEMQLKEITETPISSLPKEEQDKLKKGIDIYGEEALIRILEDYNS